MSTESPLVVPTIMKQDSRLMSLMSQLVEDLKHDADVDDMVRDTRTVKASDSGTIVVPCIAASRVESDVTTTLQALKLSKYFVLMGDDVLQYVQVVHQGKVNISFTILTHWVTSTCASNGILVGLVVSYSKLHACYLLGGAG